MSHSFPVITAEAAELIKTARASASVASRQLVPRRPSALPRKRRAVSTKAGRPFKVGVLTGASTGQSLDGDLASASDLVPYTVSR